MDELNARLTDFTLDVDDNHFGWMSPDGKFYSTGNMEHLSFARKLAKALYNSPLGDDCLKNNGWLAIHPYGLGGYLFDWRGHLTSDQKTAIKPFVETYRKWIADITKYSLFDELDIEDEGQKYPQEYIGIK